jgi:dCMP deaminase
MVSYPGISSAWDRKFLELARHISTWSKDPSKKIGAVAVGLNRNILATGYNGFPKGIQDTEERLNDRETKYELVVHAEMNCIYNAVENGVSLKGSHLYVYGLPICHECAKGVVQVGIGRVIVEDTLCAEQRWSDSFAKSKRIFFEGNVVVNYCKL